LIDGSVSLGNNITAEKILLAPGYQYQLSRAGGENLLKKVDTRPYQAWKNGKLIFRNRSLGEIAGDLERWYNVKITFSDEQIRNYRFTGTILKYKPVDQILEAIKLTSPIRYKIRVDPERSSEIVLYKL
jgi:ferric-dicitrate binding protein FerR (iron transport regulator)